ncbi:MAG: DNA repair protein RecN [Phycisphaeraceae bacterium]|nr:DNA repair protein RecN [Phycisphaeraceae bacterium]
MLRELHISNLAVIEEAHLEFHDGLNCFTGQTGAGKSLVLGAFEILLGLRSGTDYLRPGAEESRVAGVFEVRDAETTAAIGRILDQTLAAGDQLLLTRKMFSSGRSSFAANGQPVTAVMVKAVGELLVDVHGQHDHQFLLKPANQLLILDAFAGCEELRLRFADLHRRLGEQVGRLAELQASSSLRRQQLELLEFQLQEIDAAGPVLGEFEELKDRHRRLSNVQRLKRDAGQVHAALYETQGAVLERLQAMTHVLNQLAELDDDLAEPAQQVTSSCLSLQDVAMQLARYVDRLDLEPGELAEVEERLNVLNRLIAKYSSATNPGEDPLAEVLAFRDQAEAQIKDLRGQDADLSHLDRDIAGLHVELEAVGQQLRQQRQAAAEKLKPLVEAQLAELGMAEAEFDVSFELLAATRDIANCPASGLETLEMLIRPNPGQPARPLRKIASGGELSRIMLAIKSILAGNDRISVLVFDEIDANIGGRMGTVIGRKLHGLTAGEHSPRGKRGKAATGKTAPRHQVLCITHLPQIAAFGDRHFRIAKGVDGKGKDKQTRTKVDVLTGEERIAELAEMLAGKNATQTTLRQAREMIEAVA